MSLLTNEHLKEFIDTGVVVIENVLDEKEITNARNQLHLKLASFGINHDEILAGKTEAPDNIRIKGEASKIFYSKFKMDIQLRESIYLTFKDAILKGILPTETNVEKIFGNYDDVMPYIDRICWRLPDHIREEGGLSLHLDRNPWNMSLAKKYRPIQGFVTLTDQFGSESGGLKVVKGFHKKFNEYFFNSYNKTEADMSGEFYRLNDKKHTKIQLELQNINAKAGSLVLFDNRLPHATCQKLSSFDTREVIYLSYIPNVKINKKYCERQVKNFLLNIPPPSYETNDHVDRDYEIDELTKYQKKLFGID